MPPPACWETEPRRPIGPEAETGWLPSSLGRRGAWEGGGKGGNGARSQPGDQALLAPPEAALAGALPQPPLQGPVHVGDPPRDLVMQNGYDLQLHRL